MPATAAVRRLTSSCSLLDREVISPNPIVNRGSIECVELYFKLHMKPAGLCVPELGN